MSVPRQSRLSLSNGDHHHPNRAGLRSSQQEVVALVAPSPPKGKRRTRAMSLLKENKAAVDVDQVNEVVDLTEDEVVSGQPSSSHVPRRRALKRRQTSQSPVKGSGNGNGGGTVAHAHKRRLSADSAMAAMAAKGGSAVFCAPGVPSAPEFSLKGIGGVKESLKLKEMLLSQLDVIKKQSEAIMAKDKKLRELQRENERLRLRLRQMEEEERAAAQAVSPSALSSAATTPPAAVGGGPWLQDRQVFVPHTHKKQSQVDKSVLTDISDLVVPITVGCSSTEEETAPVAVTKKRRTSRKEGQRRLKSEGDGKAAEPMRKRRVLLECPDGEYPLLRGDDHVESERAEIRDILQSSAEVPGWRKVPSVMPSYSMEGTEDVENTAMLLRHAKPEADEKRRKRWDMQRAREQRRLARLKATYEKSRWNGGGSGMVKSNKVVTLQPALEGVTHLCVTDVVPVTAFGLPAPPEWAVNGWTKEEKGKEVEFALPWTVAK